MRVLVTAASRHEATAEIAEVIARDLAKRGLDAHARPIGEVADLGGYDAVVLGSAIYMGRWLIEARRFASRHATALAAMPVWLFSSGPLGPADKPLPESDAADIAAMVALTRAREHRLFAGRLDGARLGIGERAVMKVVHAPDGDGRDWAAVDAFAAEIAAALAPETPPVAAAP
jgi:menaquinone-dependent protoporphyrinogen oxidase